MSRLEVAFVPWGCRARDSSWALLRPQKEKTHPVFKKSLAKFITTSKYSRSNCLKSKHIAKRGRIHFSAVAQAAYCRRGHGWACHMASLLHAVNISRLGKGAGAVSKEELGRAEEAGERGARKDWGADRARRWALSSWRTPKRFLTLAAEVTVTLALVISEAQGAQRSQGSVGSFSSYGRSGGEFPGEEGGERRGGRGCRLARRLPSGGLGL